MQVAYAQATYEKSIGYDQPTIRDRAYWVMAGILTVAFIWVIAFMTYVKFIGWINAPIITPITTEVK